MTVRHHAATTARGISGNLERPESRVVTVALLALAGLLFLALVYWLILLTQVPSFADIRRVSDQRPTVVFAADGEPLANYGDMVQRWVPLGSISSHVTRGLIATEDHRFFDHWGIDIRRAAGSVVQTLRGDPQGGSTITMQLARNAFPELNEDTAITRKVKEWVTALRLEGVYEKEEILEMYLNAVPFMYNTEGIEAASETYFGTSASALRLDEAATLVGMLKGTSYYNPVRNPRRAHERRNVVLQQMVARGYLSEADYRELENEPTRLNFQRPSRSEEIAPHFTAYVRAWLGDWSEEHGYDLDNGGFRVYTTLDRGLQLAARDAVAEVTEGLQAVSDVEWSRSVPVYLSPNPEDYTTYRQSVAPFSYFWESNEELVLKLVEESERYEELIEAGAAESTVLRALAGDSTFVDSLKSAHQRLEAGFVAIVPGNGQVVAWVGGRDFAQNQYDHVAVAKRQPGSTFKPFVYAAALENGYSPDDRLRDEVIDYTDPETERIWSPENVDAASGQMFTLRDALAHSKNTITAQLIADVGPQEVISYARRLGIESELEPYLSLALGTSEVTLLELTSAYAAIENDGRYQRPIFINRIEDASGRVVAEYASEEGQGIATETARLLRDMLRGVVEYGTGTRIRSQYGAGGDLAGKTGTSQEGADGWFVLMRPQLVMGAWVGFELPAIYFRTDYWGQGAHTALPIVGTFDRRVRSQEAPAQEDSRARVAAHP